MYLLVAMVKEYIGTRFVKRRDLHIMYFLLTWQWATWRCDVARLSHNRSMHANSEFEKPTTGSSCCSIARKFTIITQYWLTPGTDFSVIYEKWCCFYNRPKSKDYELYAPVMFVLSWDSCVQQSDASVLNISIKTRRNKP